MQKILAIPLLGLALSQTALAGTSFDFDAFLNDQVKETARNAYKHAEDAFIQSKDAVKNELDKASQSKEIRGSQQSSRKESNGPDNFEASKRWLKQVQRENHPFTMYTDCPIRFHGKGYSRVSIVDEQCGLNVYKSANRASRGEAEHIVPASFYGWTLSCWKDGGRKNCQKTSQSFNKMEADPINLQYAVGSVNADRSNYEYSDFGLNNSSKVHDYTGKGDVLFDDVNNLFEPPESKKGWIGRVNLYMAETYGIPLDRGYLERMERWAKRSATSWECEYNNIIQRDWGYSNHYTTAACNG
jgi:deoxyribonuclease-1